MDDFERELKVGFLEEALQGLTDVEQCFLALETDPDDEENLNKIFRLAHNLKGSSKAVGFDEVGAFTHEFESFILKIKNKEIKSTPAIITVLLQCKDHVTMMITGLQSDLSATFDSKAYLEMMQAAGSGELQESSPVTASVEENSAETEANVSETVAEMEEIPEAPAAEPVATEPAPAEPQLMEQVSALSQKQPELSEVSLTPEVPAAIEKPKAPPVGAKTPVVEESIRVSLTKVEALLNSVGEMVILQSVLREQLQGHSSLIIKKTIQQLGKLSKEIQDVSMSLRMVPVKPTFQKMQRIVRDTSHALAKPVDLKMQGEETELDKTVLERINDPLVHLVRNAVDHGIEGLEARRASNKPERGQVLLNAFQQSGRLIIEVKDDGGGIHPEKIKKKAIEKGLLRPDQKISDFEAIQLVFAPGFSTKEAVTDVSGRGVGMDVVKTNIQELGGEVTIESTVGTGTCFRISLPLTLAIIDAMVVIYSGQRFVIPLGHVHETLQPKHDQIHLSTALNETLMLRGENLPLIKLGDFFSLKANSETEGMIAIVVRTGPQPFAILVDDILGQQQVVLKQLGSELANYRGVSGFTILGDGKPALILEPQDLLKRKVTLSQPPKKGEKAA